MFARFFCLKSNAFATNPPARAVPKGPRRVVRPSADSSANASVRTNRDAKETRDLRVVASSPSPSSPSSPSRGARSGRDHVSSGTNAGNGLGAPGGTAKARFAGHRTSASPARVRVRFRFRFRFVSGIERVAGGRGFAFREPSLSSRDFQRIREDWSLGNPHDVPAAMGAVTTHPRYVSFSSTNPPPTYPMPMLGASMPSASIHW